jgi:hypothetical protein
MSFGSANQAHLRYAIAWTKRLHHFDLASRAALDADSVDARERVTRGGDKDQRRKQEPDVPPEHGAECHLKIASVRAY